MKGFHFKKGTNFQLARWLINRTDWKSYPYSVTKAYTVIESNMLLWSTHTHSAAVEKLRILKIIHYGLNWWIYALLDLR